MKVTQFSLISACLLMLTACSSTKVVLIPDASGKVGQVSVATQGGEQLLTQAGESTVVQDAQKAPSAPNVLDQKQIESAFGKTLANEPAPPIRHLLYFSFDSVELNPDSDKTLPAILDDIAQRGSCDISVIGHTDRIGDSAYNRILSLRRANNVIQILIDKGISNECLRSEYYGENDPIIATPDGKSEPRNRRVEVEIR